MKLIWKRSRFCLQSTMSLSVSAMSWVMCDDDDDDDDDDENPKP